MIKSILGEIPGIKSGYADVNDLNSVLKYIPLGRNILSALEGFDTIVKKLENRVQQHANDPTQRSVDNLAKSKLGSNYYEGINTKEIEKAYSTATSLINTAKATIKSSPQSALGLAERALELAETVKGSIDPNNQDLQLAINNLINFCKKFIEDNK